MYPETIILLCLSFSCIPTSSSSKIVSWDYVHHNSTLTPDQITPYCRAVTCNGNTNTPHDETSADHRLTPWRPCYCYPPSTSCPPPSTLCPPSTRCPPPPTPCPPPPTRCPPPLTCTWVSEGPFAGRRKTSPCTTRRTPPPCNTRPTTPPCTTRRRTPPPGTTRRRTPPPCTTCSRTPLPCMTRRTPLPCTTRRTPPLWVTCRPLQNSKIGKMQLCHRHRSTVCSRHHRCGLSTILPPIHCTCWVLV